MTPPEHLFLVGFMGAGKTAVGRLLATRLERPLIDLDEEIEAGAGRSIAELFAADGETEFRDLETATLERVISTPPSAVVATGGGAFIRRRNRDAMRGGGASVWLDVAFDALAERVAGDRVVRPLFSDRAVARRLFDERLATYRLADFTVSIADSEPPAQVAARIAALTERAG